MTAERAEWLKATLVRYEGPLLSFAIKITGDKESAEDVVQEVFLRLWKQDEEKIGKYLAPWLFHVCRNLAIDKTRRDKKHGEAEIEEQPSEDKSPMDIVALKQESNKLTSLLNTLPPQHQEVVRLKFQNGFSYKEISRITGLSVTNVGFILHKSLAKLREHLEETDAAMATEGGTP